MQYESGHGLTVEALPTPRGYRSGAGCGGVDRKLCIAAGPSGIDVLQGGKWERLSDTGYDSVDLVGNVGWASGDAGSIARIEIVDVPEE